MLYVAASFVGGGFILSFCRLERCLRMNWAYAADFTCVGVWMRYSEECRGVVTENVDLVFAVRSAIFGHGSLGSPSRV